MCFFLVFYNGTAHQPKRQVYKLSDSYEGQQGTEVPGFDTGYENSG